MEIRYKHWCGRAERGRTRAQPCRRYSGGCRTRTRPCFIKNVYTKTRIGLRLYTLTIGPLVRSGPRFIAYQLMCTFSMGEKRQPYIESTTVLSDSYICFGLIIYSKSLLSPFQCGIDVFVNIKQALIPLPKVSKKSPCYTIDSYLYILSMVTL